MFTRYAGPLLGIAAIVFGGTLVGCGTQPDPSRYGEIITEVPADLNEPFPLPELEEPEPGDPEQEAPDEPNPETPDDDGREIAK